MKKILSKNTVLVSYSVHDNDWELGLWLFIREVKSIT